VTYPQRNYSGAASFQIKEETSLLSSNKEKLFITRKEINAVSKSSQENEISAGVYNK
jgi:hypothetical protein